MPQALPGKEKPLRGQSEPGPQKEGPEKPVHQSSPTASQQGQELPPHWHILCHPAMATSWPVIPSTTHSSSRCTPKPPLPGPAASYSRQFTHSMPYPPHQSPIPCSRVAPCTTSSSNTFTPILCSRPAI